MLNSLNLRVKTTECKVGIVGMYNSGKTVLLTSLINHLRENDAGRFRLGEGAIRRFKELPPEDGWAEFKYAANRDALVHQGKWPEKTKDRYQYVCQFERTDWRFSDALLRLYDLPGERIADFAMAGKDYAAWSDHVVNHFEADAGYRNLCAPFLDAVRAPNAAADDVTAAYRLALAQLILNYKPLITPSTFLLDLKGSQPRRVPAEELAASRHLGVDADSQFAPLPAGVRDSRSDLARTFAARYADYRDKVVMPFIGALASCDALMVLVDVTTILGSGVGMYNDNRQMIADLIQALEPGENGLQYLARRVGYLLLPHQLRPGGLTRCAFVAPKLDLVHPQDRDNMVSLVRQMVQKYARDCDGLRAEYFNCAAVTSTGLLPGRERERKLVGVPLYDAAGRPVPPGREQEFTVSAIPADWPGDWQAGAYTFPTVHPKMPPRKDLPPSQINLDKILDFLLV